MAGVMFNVTQLSGLNNSIRDDVEGGSGEGMGEGGDRSLTMMAIIVSVMLSVFCVLGSVGNALAFFIYYRKREKGTSTIFILSLAVTDFITCIIVMPYTVVTELLVYRHVYDIVCKTWLFIQTFNIPLSSLIMVAIAIDRYFCICHPFLHVVTVPRAKVCVGILTLVAALMGVVPALAHGVYYHLIEVVEVNKTVDDLSPSFSVSSSSWSDSDGLATTTATTTTPSGSTANTGLYTNGLFLEPAAEFMSDLVGHGAPINYRTQTSNLPSTTSLPTALSESPEVSMNLSSVAYNVATNWTTVKVNKTVIAYVGSCVPNDIFLHTSFVNVYQKVYAAFYLFEFVIIAVLYALIYRSILVRRAWKAKRKRMSCYASTNCPETVAEETQLTNINGTATETVLVKKNPGRFSTAMRDRTLYANIKTAAMLFVVTVFFVISFLPSWLMGLRLLPFNMIVFYMYYLNNVINPIIYAFMNRTFREDLFQLIKACFRRR